MADVPVGIVLSGGLDSSLVATVANDAANRYNRPTPECWTVAESEDNPDWMAAELVASSLDLNHHQSIMEADSFHKHFHPCLGMVKISMFPCCFSNRCSRRWLNRFGLDFADRVLMNSTLVILDMPI